MSGGRKFDRTFVLMTTHPPWPSRVRADTFSNESAVRYITPGHGTSARVQKTWRAVYSVFINERDAAEVARRHGAFPGRGAISVTRRAKGPPPAR